FQIPNTKTGWRAEQNNPRNGHLGVWSDVPHLFRTYLLCVHHCALGSEGYRTFGKRKATVAPLPGVLSQASSPCMAATSFLTMLRPRPVEGSPAVGRAESRV